MYAISLHGSNSEYFVTLLATFCHVPIVNAETSVTDVDTDVEALAVAAFEAETKNGIASITIVKGVSDAAHFQPSCDIIVEADNCNASAIYPTL
mmetsp:Transcript_5902/g.8861  ORF Transcript_5902/g.8861 Transcript_5902/m.8861 type:complete len:94 (-) Transcript_5902:632-913(-)